MFLKLVFESGYRVAKAFKFVNMDNKAMNNDMRKKLINRRGSRETFVYRLKFPLAFVKSSAWKLHINLLVMGREGNKV